jgi:hypothetical protein
MLRKTTHTSGANSCRGGVSSYMITSRGGKTMHQEVVDELEDSDDDLE